MQNDVVQAVKRFLRNVEGAGIPPHVIRNADDHFLHFQILRLVRGFRLRASLHPGRYIDFLEATCHSPVLCSLRHELKALVNHGQIKSTPQDNGPHEYATDYDLGTARTSDESPALSLKDLCTGIIEAQLAYGSAPPDNEMEQRIERLADICQLSPMERDILIFLFLRQTHAQFSDLFDALYSPRTRRSREFAHLAQILQVPRREVYRALGAGHPLIELDIIERSNSAVKLADGPLAYLEGIVEGPYHDAYFEPIVSSTPRLKVDDFMPAVRNHLTQIIRMIEGASPDRGVATLFYGPPGTGKSEAAKTIAAQLGKRGRSVYALRTHPRFALSTMVPKSNFRLNALLASSIMDPENAVVVCDEADEVLSYGRPPGSFFPGADRANPNKDKLNDFLDHNRIPLIFIVNSHLCIDESTKRRFDYSVRFPSLGPAEMHQIWEKTIDREGLGEAYTREDIAAISREFSINPGGMALAVRSVKKLIETGTPAMEATRQILGQHCLLMCGRDKSSSAATCPAYTPEIVNITSGPKLLAIMDMLSGFTQSRRARSASPYPYSNLNLLLWGAPGTGKTEFVRYVSRELGIKLITRTPGDILSMFVGGTERNVMEAFSEASEENAILFFDEIDGLLTNRQSAMRDHEVSRVNELLLRMESFQGIFMASTNLKSRLDHACLRRFALKIEFGYLENTGKVSLFNRILQPLTDNPLTVVDADRLAGIAPLTPGDFKVVAQQAALPSQDGLSNRVLLDRLAAEAANRPNTCARRIGFARAC